MESKVNWNNLKVNILAPYEGINREITDNLHNHSSSLASDRLQVTPMVKTLQKMGALVRCFSLNTSYDLSDLSTLKKSDVCIAAKMRPGTKTDRNLFAQFHISCVLQQKANGAKIITIYSDHIANFKPPYHEGELYRNLLHLSDCIIYPSRQLRENAASWANPNASQHVIVDPCQLNRKPFRKISHDKYCQIIWFGNISNLPYLIKSIPELVSHSPINHNYKLIVLTSKDCINSLAKKLQKIYNKCPKNWKFQIITWDYQNQPMQLEYLLDESHIAFLPSDPCDPYKNGASHNRLIDSIQTGCLTIASPINSYKEMSNLCLIDHNPSHCIAEAITNNSYLCDLYESKRELELKRFSPEENFKNWKNAFESLYT